MKQLERLIVAAKITPKQDHFARVYVETSNASEAYRQAYDVGEKTTPEAVWVNACKTLGHAKVAQRVADLQMAARERTLVTVESISKELDENRAAAKAWEQSASMNAASLGKAKLHGLLPEKVQLTSPDGTMSPTQSQSAVLEAMRRKHNEPE